jgi:4-hydroxybutyrate dehydrogenase
MSLITYLTRIHFADRVVEDALAEELARLGVARPLIVADADAGGGDDLERVLAVLPGGGAGTLTVGDRTAAHAARAVIARVAKTGCDGLLALGGGAALDAARLAGLAGPRPGALAALLAGSGIRALGAGSNGLPVIAVPTLPGQGLGLCASLRVDLPDEFGPRRIAAEGLMPALLLCDPTLGLDAPPQRLAETGFDALTHCVETWLSTAWNPPADGMALDGVRRAAATLERAVGNPRDLDARRELLAAGLNGGLAGAKGLGAVHALAHALEAEPEPGAGSGQAAEPARQRAGGGGLHGRFHAAILPAVLAFNAPAVPDRMAPLARALDLPDGGAIGPALARLGARIGLPASVSALGLDGAARARIARRAEAEPANRSNPRLAVAEDYAAMLAAAEG